MGKKLRVIGPIGLALFAVYAFGAFSAPTAQAAVHWNVAGVELAEGKEEEVAETVELEGAMTLTVPNFFRISCKALRFVRRFIRGRRSGRIADIILALCTVLNKGGEATKCAVKSSGGTLGTIETAAIVDELKEVSGSAYDFLTPASGTTLTTLVIEASGGACALSGTYVVNGSLAFKIPTGTNEASLTIEASEAIQKAAGAKLLLGERESFVDGKGKMKLVSGKTWGVGL